ncbi:hypothetical protein F5148DRAFT_1327094 [Russula earlei]|uniref:Uncharacterized protein n=1 Tax=Russula earlei TaxID=71964 RepID=A0ACC0UHT6_9AGAM|nr:hypothetical protein F5148DRAFT_1327094 [Russula earlei]
MPGFPMPSSSAPLCFTLGTGYQPTALSPPLSDIHFQSTIITMRTSAMVAFICLAIGVTPSFSLPSNRYDDNGRKVEAMGSQIALGDGSPRVIKGMDYVGSSTDWDARNIRHLPIKHSDDELDGTGPAHKGQEGSPAHKGQEGSPAHEGQEASPAHEGQEAHGQASLVHKWQPPEYNPEDDMLPLQAHDMQGPKIPSPSPPH